MKKLYFILLSILFISSCKEHNEKLKDKTIIPVADAVGQGEILKLSDYAKSIEYIPLETNDSVLISDIQQIAYENHRIVIKANGECVIFDERGHCQGRLGHKGMGPNEFVSIKSFDILPNQHIFLTAYPRKYFLYTLDGELIKRISYPNFPDDCIPIKTMSLYSNYYFSDVVSSRHIHYKGFLIEEQDNRFEIEKEYPNYMDMEKENKNGFSLIHEAAHLYRYNDEICFHKNINDTVFSIDSTLEIKKRFVFDFGTYGASASWLLETTSDKTPKYIWPLNIQESERFVFLDFFFGNHAPEKFEYMKRYGSEHNPKKATNYEVYGLFNKQTGYLHLLDQPIRKQLGFLNDIDNGLCFWPKYVSSDNKMISYWNSDDFLELYEQVENPASTLEQIAANLSPDSNPIIVVITLK